ncbi:GAF domain-containing protein [Myxosarcina sp. GI1]|uniref:GAF domain-containing protein n=1 Tax=Myxosarcina sp. GI1 TaxID=1541065 RepID=UPI0005605539|nr:GAF domain-containing protein [Myxosarcina sp. GI1]
MSEPNDLDKIASEVLELLQAETAVVAVAESNGEVLYYAAAAGKHAAAIKDKRGATATSGLCGTAMNSNCPVLVAKTSGDPRVRQDYVKSLGIETALAVPFQDRDKLLGAIMVLNRVDGSLFDERAEQLLVNYVAKVTPLLYRDC